MFLFISLVLSSSILHADLNPVAGAGAEMAKDAVTDAVKEKVADGERGGYAGSARRSG